MKKKRHDHIIAIFLIIVIFIGIRIFQNSTDKENEQLSQIGITTVGKITKRAFSGRLSSSGYSYNYIYYVNDIKYEGGSLKDEKYPEGSFFEATCLPDTPHKSRLEFDVSISPDSVCNYFKNDCPFLQ